MTRSSLSAELSTSPGRFGLIEDGPGACDVVIECEEEFAAARCPVGASLTVLPEPPSSDRVEIVLRSCRVLVDIEILFAAELAVDPLALLRRLARGGPTVALWPGVLRAGRASFSVAQREDGYDRPVEDVLVLRPVPRVFPDEPCFEIERWLT